MKFAENSVTQWRSDMFYAVSLDLFDRCFNWYNQSSSFGIGDIILERVLPCCETEEKAAAPNSGFVRDNRIAQVAFFHPSAASCYRQATITRYICTWRKCHAVFKASLAHSVLVHMHMTINFYKHFIAIH